MIKTEWASESEHIFSITYLYPQLSINTYGNDKSSALSNPSLPISQIYTFTKIT